MLIVVSHLDERECGGGEGGALEIGECKIPGGVGEARWDACKGVKERESRKKMIGGERKRKRCERERD